MNSIMFAFLYLSIKYILINCLASFMFEVLIFFLSFLNSLTKFFLVALIIDFFSLLDICSYHSSFNSLLQCHRFSYKIYRNISKYMKILQYIIFYHFISQKTCKRCGKIFEKTFLKKVQIA